MDIAAVVKSFFLGLGIGVVLQVLGLVEATLLERVLTVLASGGIGLVIGAATEYLTSLLPIRIARTASYFLINNLIAMAISALVVSLMLAFASEEDRAGRGWPNVVTVVAIVGVANVVDYLLYRRTQRRLHEKQAQLARLVDVDDEPAG